MTVNGAAADLDEGVTVADLVRTRNQERRRVAVARNGEVVPRIAWEATRIEDGDRIEVLVAVAGG